MNKLPEFISAIFIALAILSAIVGCWVMKSNHISEQKSSLTDIQDYLGSGSNQSISWFQKVELEYEGYTASSTIQVIWSENSPRVNDAPWIPDVKGSLPAFTLESGEYVFVLMRNGIDDVAAKWHLRSAQGYWPNEADLTTEALDPNVQICTGNPLMPYVVKVLDPGDPQKIQIFTDPVCLWSKIIIGQKESQGIAPDVLPWLTELTGGKRSAYQMPVGGVGETGIPLARRLTQADFFK